MFLCQYMSRGVHFRFRFFCFMLIFFFVVDSCFFMLILPFDVDSLFRCVCVFDAVDGERLHECCQRSIAR